MSNEQKIPLSRSLPQFTQQRILEEINKRGQALPGSVEAVSGSIVTVNFEVVGVTLPKVQMPLFGPEYIRYPVQKGDKGVAFPASVSLAGITGLGATGAAASFDVLQGNLSTLVWFPIASTKWSPVADANAVTIYGPDGATIRDTGNASSIVLTPFGITMTSGGHTIVINSTGVIIDEKVFLTHVHTLVQTGTSDSGPVGP